jgi:hypothetical protein
LPSAGAIVGELDYTYDGDAKQPETLSVTVSGKRASDGEIKSLTLSWLDAKTKNTYWTSQPEQQLCYAGARVWARRWTPGPLLGIYAPEEMAAERKAAKEAEHTGPTLEATPERDAINDAVPLKPAAAATPRAERKVDPTVYEAPPKSTHTQGDIYDQHNIAIELLNVGDSRSWLANLEMLLAEAQSQEAVVVIGGCESVKRTIAKAPGAIRARVDELLANAYKRFAEPEGAELPEVEIAGEDKVAAGD